MLASAAVELPPAATIFLRLFFVLAAALVLWRFSSCCILRPFKLSSWRYRHYMCAGKGGRELTVPSSGIAAREAASAALRLRVVIATTKRVVQLSLLTGCVHMRLGARVCVCVGTCAARLLFACAARLLRGECLMLVRHAACASVWACAGQRHFVPRTYPGHTKSPLSTPAADPQQGGTTCCWCGEKELPLTALQTGSRRGVAMQ
jgi:hypothetical protein